MSDAGDKRHENVYVRLPDSMAVLGSALPLPAIMGTAMTTVNRMELISEGFTSCGCSRELERLWWRDISLSYVSICWDYNTVYHYCDVVSALQL